MLVFARILHALLCAKSSRETLQVSLSKNAANGATDVDPLFAGEVRGEARFSVTTIKLHCRSFAELHQLLSSERVIEGVRCAKLLAEGFEEALFARGDRQLPGLLDG